MSKLVAPHREVPVKVNAWVDKGVAGIVKALSEFDNVVTFESCQGAKHKGMWVCFQYRADNRYSSQALSYFVLEFLGPRLASELGDLATVQVHTMPGGSALGEIMVRAGAERRVESILRQLSCTWAIGAGAKARRLSLKQN